MLQKKLSDITPGEIIASDVYRHDRLVVKAGTEITKELKIKLRKLGVKEIVLETRNEKEKENESVNPLTPFLKVDKSKLFYDLLKLVFSESRYGLALNNLKDVLFLEQTFVSILDDHTEQLFMKLKEWDHYSFLHSFDVFVLGTILSKSLELHDALSFAKGCLLHDIGKLHVPRDILQKKGKLTENEYDQIKKHVEEGSKLLTSFSMPTPVINLAKSHHERIDGSGYLDQIREYQLDPELKLMMVVDVYSALTLDRSYRKALHSIEAIEYLYQNLNLFDENSIKLFCDSLKIYPKGATVSLSTSKIADILYVSTSKPYLPLLKEESGRIYELPKDFSIRIDKLVKYKARYKMRRKKEWELFLTSLIQGNRTEALSYLDHLSDKMRVEEIYSDIFAKVLQTLGDKWKNNEITIAEEHIASTVIREIMDSKLIENDTQRKDRGKIVLLTIGTEQHKLPLKMVSDSLSVNGWETYNLENTLPVTELIDFIKKHEIDYIGFSVTMNENLPLLKRVIQSLEKAIPNITIVVGGQAVTKNKDNFSNYLYAKDSKEAIYLLNNHYEQKLKEAETRVFYTNEKTNK